ncbi:MAG: GntR family transcriptional regulator [Kiritimatiellae bacterium]|nr:GntR family transcriptional regulator [Kiritimatiellia bacterium]
MVQAITIDAVADAAKKIESDLQFRGLSKGERYISAGEAGSVIGVSMATADRAMRMLVEKGVLIRQRGRGTFVGPKAFEGVDTNVRSIQIIMPRLNESLGLSLEDTIRGIHAIYPDVPVAINVFSTKDPLSSLKRVLSAYRGNGGVVGFGLILVPRAIQEEVVQRKLPAVLLGTPFPGVKGLVSIDLDYRSLGEILAADLLKRGHKRFGMLLRENIAPGDTAMLTGVKMKLGSAGICCDALSLRYCALERDCVHDTLRELLTMENPPTALIGYPFSEANRWVTEVADELGLTVGKDFEYLTGLGATSPSPANCPARCCMPPDEVGKCFGRLLAEVAREDVPQKAQTILPVELKP